MLSNGARKWRNHHQHSYRLSRRHLLVSRDALQIEVLTELSSLERFEPEWAEFFERSAASASPHLSPQWLVACWKHFARGFELRFCVARRSGRVVGVFPLMLGRERVGPFWCRVLRFAQDGWANTNDALVEEGESDVLREVFVRLAAERPRWAQCRLSATLPSSVAYSQLKDGGVGGTYPAVAEQQDTAIIMLPSTWTEYRAQLGKSMKNNLRYYANVLSREGPVRVERMGLTPPRPEEAPRLETLLNDAVSIHPHTWQARASFGTSIGQPGVEPFFREVSHRLAAVGMLDLSVLYAGSRPVSFMWGVARRGRISITKIGFDQRLEECRPGSLHMARLIEESIGLGATEVSLGGENIKFKVQWTRNVQPVYRLHLYPRRLVPTLLRWWVHGRRKPS